MIAAASCLSDVVAVDSTHIFEPNEKYSYGQCRGLVADDRTGTCVIAPNVGWERAIEVPGPEG